MVKIPYGISNFETLVKEGYLYVDRTPFIEVLEQMSQRYLVFVRPRRFGKSLFISVLEYYYGIEYKSKFTQLFEKYYIGKNPTPSVNRYLILKFDYSQMNTSSFQSTYDSFLQNTKDGVLEFLDRYPTLFGEISHEEVKEVTFPSHALQYALRITKTKATDHKIYLLIDEYDHFANEILSFRFQEFTKMVGQNGFVRKFYESIKVGTQSGVIDRLFITGVSPLTLDSLTSGFNISTNITLEEEFNEMMGFTESEVINLLKTIGITTAEITRLVPLLRKWYDGYLFAENATTRLYNSDMVLYFAVHLAQKKQYPKTLLDPNIASDYNKIRRLFKIKNQEGKHLAYLEELLETGEVKAPLVLLFELEKRFDKKDFISLLFYTGILTIKERDWANVVFRMPNYVIEQLYYQYFYQLLLERGELPADGVDLNEIVKAIAIHSDLHPLVEYTQSLLTELSNRDKRKFDERYLKLIFTSVFFANGIYNIHHELEVKNSLTTKGYVDILLTKRPPYKPTYQIVLELKYIKKAAADTAATVIEEAIQQLQAYLKYDDYLQGLENLRAYVILFVGNEGQLIEVEMP